MGAFEALTFESIVWRFYLKFPNLTLFNTDFQTCFCFLTQSFRLFITQPLHLCDLILFPFLVLHHSFMISGNYSFLWSRMELIKVLQLHANQNQNIQKNSAIILHSAKQKLPLYQNSFSWFDKEIKNSSFSATKLWTGSSKNFSTYYLIRTENWFSSYPTQFNFCYPLDR